MRPTRAGVGTLLSVLIVASTSAARAAVEPSAEIRIEVGDDCAGEGYWWIWDTALHADPTDTPGYNDGRAFEVHWDSGSPIEITAIVGSVLEANRVAFRLTDQDQVELFRAFLSVAGDRFVLDVTLDCSTIPYTIVRLGDTAMELPSASTGPPIAVVVGIGLVVGSLMLVGRRAPVRR